MRTSKVIHIVGCHAEGEVGDVIVGGVAPPPGETLWEQRDFLASDQVLRKLRPERTAWRRVPTCEPTCSTKASRRRHGLPHHGTC